MAPGISLLSDEQCDPIIRILDENAKGNTKQSDAVARAMVAQGACEEDVQWFPCR